MTTYTISTVGGKTGSILVVPSDAHLMPDYYLNVKGVKLIGNNPFLADNITLNPAASISLFCQISNTYLIKDMLMSSITQIGGSATPATLALTLASLAVLLAA